MLTNKAVAAPGSAKARTIPVVVEHLQKEAAALEDQVQLLAERLVPVLSQPEIGDEGKAALPETQAPLAQIIEAAAEKLDRTRRLVNAILERLEL